MIIGRIFILQALDAETHICALSERFNSFCVDPARALSQWRLARNILRQPASASSTIASSLSLADTCHNVPIDFHDLRLLYKIAMTIPITTATVERGFSKLLYIKNKLRSTMQQERLEALMLASVEKDIMLKISVDDLVSKFASFSERRLSLNFIFL